MPSSRILCAALVLVPLGCGGPSVVPDLPKQTGTGEAFGGTECSAVRPQTEPDLMGGTRDRART
jgi:hypothetical protein